MPIAKGFSFARWQCLTLRFVFAALRLCVKCPSRENRFTQRREDTQSQTKTLPARWWWRCLRWHAHLARGFTGGTPVPLFQTAPLPARRGILHTSGGLLYCAVAFRLTC